MIFNSARSRRPVVWSHAIDFVSISRRRGWFLFRLRATAMLRAGKDEHFAITCSDDKTVRLWDVRTGKQHRKFVGHQDYVFACSVHPTSTLFCSGSFDETIKL